VCGATRGGGGRSSSSLKPVPAGDFADCAAFCDAVPAEPATSRRLAAYTSADLREPSMGDAIGESSTTVASAAAAAAAVAAAAIATAGVCAEGVEGFGPVVTEVPVGVESVADGSFVGW